MADAPGYRAVIFDMDGVLTDSEPAFHAAVNEILGRYGERLPLAEYRDFIGIETAEMWRRVIGVKRLPVSVDEVVDAYEAPLMARLRERRPTLPGARRLIAALHARDVPVGLCSASHRRWVDAVLESTGLTGLFDAISSGDDAERPKPDPAPYLLAAAQLGRAPQACVVVEDSRSGIASALAAGAYVIQLRATSTAAEPVRGVGRVISSLHEFPLEMIVSRDAAGRGNYP